VTFMSRRHLVLRIFFVVCLAVASLAEAGTVQELSFERLIAESDVIVRGRVEELKTRQASDQRSIMTIVKVSVERQFKGPIITSLRIEQPGGTIGDIVQGVPGLPEFSSDEKVIIFLKHHRRDAYRIVGGKQGKFTIKTLPNKNEVVEDLAHRTEALDTFVDRLTNTIKRGN
jgi:hypothetical protein